MWEYTRIFPGVLVLVLPATLESGFSLRFVTQQAQKNDQGNFLRVELFTDMLMVVPLQVVAELQPFEKLEGQTRVGAESSKARSYLAEWRKRLKYAFQQKALATARRSIPKSYLPHGERYC